MDRKLESRIATAMATRFPAALGVRVRNEKGRFVFRIEKAPPLLSLSHGEGEWTLSGFGAHAHFDRFEEALELVLSLLAGESRFAQEYRGDTLASAWIERGRSGREEGAAYAMEHIVSFLSPFEADEWTLWPGERWRIVRRTIKLGASETDERFEREADASAVALPSLNALNKALGDPVEGLRWALGGDGHFVFQAPSGWRRRLETDDSDREHNLIDFNSPSRGLAFRARCYFREAERRSAQVQERAIRPYSVERGFPESGFFDPRGQWNVHAWTLLFSDGQEEMMGILELRYIETTRWSAEQLRRLIAKSLSEARFVPREWNLAVG